MFLDRDLLEIAPESGNLDAIESLAQRWLDRSPELPLLLAGGMENQPELVDRLLRLGLQCGVDRPMLDKLRSIHSWEDWAIESGMKWPETWTTPLPDSESHSDRQWLKKNILSAAGLGVVGFDSLRNRRTESNRTESKLGEYFQEFRKGEVIGLTFLSDRERTQWVGSAMSWPTGNFDVPEPWLYRGSVGPILLDVRDCDCVTALGNIVRRDSGIRGLWQADCIRDENGLWLLEINPRWSASMELLDASWDATLVAYHAQAILGATLPQLPEQSDTSRLLGKTIVYAQSNWQPSLALWTRWWSQRWNGATEELLEQVRLADIPSSCDEIPAGYPVLSCIAADACMESVYERLLAAAEDAIRDS